MNRRPAPLLLAAGALAATFLLTACGDDAGDAVQDPTSAAPTATPDTTPAPLGAGVLLTDDDTVYSDGADWFRVGTGDEDLDVNGDLAHPCLPDGLSGTGATRVVRADFELRSLEDPAIEVVGDFLTQLVGQYDDEAAATAAAETVRAALEECADRPAAITDYRSMEPRAVDVPGATASVTDAHYGPVPAEIDPHGDSAHIMETGVLVQGDRVVVLTSVIIGQDYNFVDGTPVELMLPKAAARLG